MRFLSKSIFIIITGLVLLIIATIALGAYGYSELETEFDASNFSPEVNVSPESVINLIIDIFSFNYLEAATDLIDGVRIDGTLRFINNSFIPLYIPEMEHQVYIDGQPSKEKFRTPSFWLGPSSHQDEEMSMVVDLEDVPEILLEVLANGGTSNVKIYSEFSLGTFTIVKESTKTFNINNSISSYIDSPPADTNVNFDGWHVGGSPVTTASKGDTVTAVISLLGGETGDYTIQIRRDISFGADEIVKQVTFSYDGSTTTQQISFVTPYATGESSTTGYHLDILKDGITVWSMTNSYPPRLRVTAISGGPLSINFNGWFVNSSQVTTASKGDRVTAVISLLGGETGDYTIQIRRDISFGADEIVKQVTFSYDGSTTTQQISFVTPYATGESSTNGYHLDVLKDGITVWSMTNSYPPRLRVVST